MDRYWWKMKIIYKMESVLITITGILCTILLLKLLYTLRWVLLEVRIRRFPASYKLLKYLQITCFRSILPWRVNCWFCNYNFWVKFAVRNCWTCPKCEQYNGFTKVWYPHMTQLQFFTICRITLRFLNVHVDVKISITILNLYHCNDCRMATTTNL